ncbi:hypothetical protein MRBLRH8O_000164 [Agrobacterium radiobacter]|uniref:hypothetical protein n=1 Tax=Agrobacterium radiobacter TaxID=362 RepID=UPI0034660361
MNHRHADFQAASVEPKTAAYEEISVKPGGGSQALSGELSNREDLVKQAANWLRANRDTCQDRLIPTLKERFGLCNIEAIAAAKSSRTVHQVEVR